MLDNPSGFGDVERMQPRNQQTLFGTQAWSSATRWPQFGIAYRGSVVKCARSQVRPFHDDDEAAHEHVTEHMRDLGERLLHEGDFSYENITGQDEPPVDSPLAPGKHSDRNPQDPTAKDRWMWTPKREDEREEKPDPSALSSQRSHQSQALMHYHKKQREIMMTREDESMNLSVSPVSTVAPVPFDSETRNDEIAVDVPVPEEPTEIEWRERSGLDHRRSILHSLAWCATSATAQGGKDEPIVTCSET